MSWIEAIILALIQGVTEFLPVSSSAHLILPSQLFGFEDQGLAFDVAVHFGTLLAVCWYYREQLFDLMNANLDFIGDGTVTSEAKLSWLIVLATIPAGLAGILFGDFIESKLRYVAVIATTTIIFGLLLWFADRKKNGTKTQQGLTFKDAIIIGVAQALALIPGTSRSGITMTAALLLGYKREDSANISFLLSIPIIAAATALKTVELVSGEVLVDWGLLGLGVVVSFLFAYFTISLFMKLLEKIGFMPFVSYRLVLGGILFGLLAMGVIH